MNRIFTLIVSFFLLNALYGQSSTSNLKVDYDNDSRWFWTLNTGVAWTTADVKNTDDNEWGWGITLGKSFNYNYGRPVSFDLRFRYLTGTWYGQDFDTTGFGYGNNALSNGTTNYNTTLGYAVLNHSTKVHELGLELVLHANNIRANSGWDPYIFGGINYSFYRAKGDQINSKLNGEMYMWDSLFTTSNFNQTSIKEYLDGDAETVLDGSSNDFTGRFMPSLGIGLGYQLGKRFSLGIEHKTTFTMADVFDGSVNPNGKYPNDWYHYTGAYLRFHIKDHQPVAPDPDPIIENNSSLNNVNNYDQAGTKTPPVVDFTNPAASGTVVTTPNYVVRAKIQNVSSSNNVIFRQNGNYNTNFTFNPSTQSFESVVVLQPGQNVFELTGNNTFGSDQEQTIVIYNREQQNPPVVTYQNPATSPATVQQQQFLLSATVLNVQNQGQISVTLNGAPVSFNFYPNNATVNSTLNLAVGTNIVTTTGTNPYGSDQETVTIIYNPIQTEQPPVVYFVDPQMNPYTTSNNTFVINADVLNVQGAQNILFKQNGTVNQNFVYNAQTDDFQSNVVLTPGQNVFEIVATNSAGSAQASTIIIYNRQAPKPPIVTITNPANSPYQTSNVLFNLQSTVLNVTQQNQITVKVNGQNVAFTYNNTANSVSATLSLVEGANTVTVTGTNADGSDAASTTIVYTKPVTINPPVVQVTNPSTDPFNTTTENYTLTASVFNVSSVSGVNVNVNGANNTVFTFANGIVTLPLTLIEGTNIITVTGTNSAGTASDQQTIIYRKPAPAQPPVVSFIQPATSPFTVFNATTSVKVRVRYVTAASQINLNINGQVATNFTYSASSEIMDFTTALVPGANIITVTGTNSVGSAQATTTIIYREPNPTLPPVVTITNPSENPSNVQTATTPIAATVLNVDNASAILVAVNNVQVSNFTYNTVTKQVNFIANLNEGVNTVTVSASNSAGQASDSRNIRYTRQVTVIPPLVTFLNPAAPGTNVNQAPYVVKAKVINVTMANQIVMFENGQALNPSLYVFDPATHEVTYNTTLNSGNNVYTVTGTNSGGSHTASTNIIYTPPVVACDKPVLTFVTPVNPGTTVPTAPLMVSATITNITSANQVKLFINGVLQSVGSYNAVSKVFTKQVQLNAGQNAIEIIAENNCGNTSSATTITYREPAAPCLPPTVSKVDPINDNSIVEVATGIYKAAVTNVTDQNQLSVTVNNAPVNFQFDAVTHIVTTNINLNLGVNNISIKATNACGTQNTTWSITRRECTKPVVTITNSPVPSGGTVIAGTVELVASVTGVTSENQITVTKDGQAVSFVYNVQSGILTTTNAINDGLSTFEIKGVNSCGEGSVVYKIYRKTPPQVKPPTIVITNPSSANSTVYVAGSTIQFSSTGVNQNQITVTLNGQPMSFIHNAQNGQGTFNATFQEGANVIIATAVNSAGSATDTKTVIYSAPVVVNPPVITLTNPATCPMAFNRGNQTITGQVTNISNASQVVITYNGSNIAFTSTIANNTLQFSFPINIGPTTQNFPLIITATNAGGTDVKTCSISLLTSSNNGHGNNTDGTDESNPGNGSGGPNGGNNGTVDDENGNNNGNGGAITVPNSGNGGTRNPPAPTPTPQPRPGNGGAVKPTRPAQP